MKNVVFEEYIWGKPSKMVFVVFMETNKEFVKCQNCEKVIAEVNDIGMVPSAEDCYKMGNVPVPNMGWLCSQECANEFEKKYDVTFGRTKGGKVDYYAS